MKIVVVLSILLCSFAQTRADVILTSSELDKNAYVRLYTEWVELDKNNLERLRAIARNADAKLQRARILYPKMTITLEELQDKETAYELARLTVVRQEIKIRESEDRLAVVRSRVAAGILDIPLCSRPGDGLEK